MDPRTVATIAADEFKANARNRWTIAFSWVFAALTLAISYFGTVTIAQVGFQGFTRTAASLLNLVLYLVPLVALMMGGLSFGDRGLSELLFSQPVNRSEVLVGKLLGIYGALAAALLFGFGASGLVIALQSGEEGLGPYLVFTGLTLLLALVFVVLGGLVAIIARNRARALGANLAVWFFFVLFYDLLVIGTTFLLREHTANVMIFVSLFGNPVDIVRVASLITLGGGSIFGTAGALLLKFLGGQAYAVALLTLTLAGWILIPTLISGWVLKRRDI